MQKNGVSFVLNSGGASEYVATYSSRRNFTLVRHNTENNLLGVKFCSHIAKWYVPFALNAQLRGQLVVFAGALLLLKQRKVVDA